MKLSNTIISKIIKSLLFFYAIPFLTVVSGYAQNPHKASLYWSTYELQVIESGDIMSEAIFNENIDWVEQNLKPYGYNLIWMDGGKGDQGLDNLSKNGYLLSHSGKWTNDFDYYSSNLKNRGMQLGMYENPLWVHMAAVNAGYKIVGTDIPLSNIINPDEGATWFTWVQVDKAGAEQYVKGYVQHWANMGIKHLNADFLSWYEDGFDKNMGTVGPARPHEHYVTAMKWIKDACDANGIMFKAVMPHLKKEGEVERTYGHSVRINEDVGDGTWARFSDLDRGIRHNWWSQWYNAMDGYAYWSYISGRGSMILDGDFVRLNTMSGNVDEMKSMISQHLMAGGPIGVADQKKNIGNNLWLYQNTELLSLNTDGFVGKPKSNDPTSVNSQIWKGQMSNGDWVVALFNRESSPQNRSVDFSIDLGITGDATVRDLWQHKDLGTMRSYSASVPAHGCIVLKIVPANTGDTTPPASPQSLTATAVNSSQIDLDWADNTETDLSYYNVKRSTAAGGPYTQIATNVAASFYSDKTLSASTKYYYVVTAVDNSGNQSANSNEASATTLSCSLPTPWVNSDIGSVTPLGSACHSSGTFAVKGAGADIEGSADAFHYAYYQVSGDVTVTARVESITNTNAWAKAGVMIRETLNANSVNAMTALTPSNGVTFQRRTSTGGSTSASIATGITAPYWVRIKRELSTVSAWHSPDGVSWTQVGSNVTIDMASTVYIGLAVTSHSDGTLCTGMFSHVTVSTLTSDVTPPAAPQSLAATGVSSSQIDLDWADNTETDLSHYNVKRSTTAGGPYTQIATNVITSLYSDKNLSASTKYYYVVTAVDHSANESANSNEASATTQGGCSLPTPWVKQDIGSVAAAGDGCYSSSQFNNKGSGVDIEDKADEFHYIYYSVSGDVTITAKVESLTNTDAWAKAGVMIRETLNANSINAMTAVTPSNGITFQRRTSTGGGTSATVARNLAAPYWVRIQRVGSTVSGWRSPDGVSWTQVGSNVSINMASTVYIGLAVTSHSDGTIASGIFSNVSVTTSLGTVAYRIATKKEDSTRTLQKEANIASIYPNPADKEIIIHFVKSPDESVAVSVIDALGRRIYRQDTNDQELSINISTYAEGVYIIKGKVNKRSFNEKLIIKR